MKPIDFFVQPQHITQKRYEALRAFFCEKKSAEEVAKQFGYTLASVYSLTTDFKRWIKSKNIAEYFFITHSSGRKSKPTTRGAYSLLVALRKRYLSVPDIKAILDSQGYQLSEKYIYLVLKKEGFARLPRRNNQIKNIAINTVEKFSAAKSQLLTLEKETLNVIDSLGALCILPYIQRFGIAKIISTAGYPNTKTLPTLNSILCFVALKLSNVRRYTKVCKNYGQSMAGYPILLI